LVIGLLVCAMSLFLRSKNKEKPPDQKVSSRRAPVAATRFENINFLEGDGRRLPRMIASPRASVCRRLIDTPVRMSIQVYGCNHVAIDVGDIEEAVAFYTDVFGLEKLDEGEGDAFFKLGEHQFLAMFEDKRTVRARGHAHFGIMVRDEAQLGEVREKLVGKYHLELIPGFRCDFRDPWGNRIQVVDLHDESLIWLLPYREVQKAGVKFFDQR
jgi:catechol 2,3-dioxygenase-like lactoylglutathione lyase family enzyme